MLGLSRDERYSRLKETRKLMGDLSERLSNLKLERNDLRWRIERIEKEERPTTEKEAATKLFNKVGEEIKEIEKQLYITSYILQHSLSKCPPCLVLWQEEHYKPIILCCIIYDAVYSSIR